MIGPPKDAQGGAEAMDVEKQRIDMKDQRRRRGIWIALALGLAAGVLRFGADPIAMAQNPSGGVVSDAEYTSAYDAFMKTNRFIEAPGEDEDARGYWGRLRTQLENQAGRNLIKRPKNGFSEDAFFGWLAFARAYGDGTNVGACAACHTPPGFTDGKAHDIGTGGKIETPSLREIGQKDSFFRDGSAKSLEEAIARHAEIGGLTKRGERAGIDPALSELSLGEKEIGQVAAFLRSLKSVDRAEFRNYLIKIDIQPLEFEFE